jgi:hypothetical protein
LNVKSDQNLNFCRRIFGKIAKYALLYTRRFRRNKKSASSPDARGSSEAAFFKSDLVPSKEKDASLFCVFPSASLEAVPIGAGTYLDGKFFV